MAARITGNHREATSTVTMWTVTQCTTRWQLPVYYHHYYYSQSWL